MQAVKVYGKTVCPNCDKAKNFLDSKGIEYEYVNLEEDIEKFFELKSQGIRAVPVIEIGEELLDIQQLMKKY